MSEIEAVELKGQTNRVIGRDLVRMVLGQTPTEWRYLPEPWRRGSPNHKGLDKAWRLIYAMRYAPTKLDAAVCDYIAFLGYQEEHGQWKFAAADEGGTASHFHHWLLLLSSALWAAREIQHAGLLVALRTHLLGLRALLLVCSAPDGTVVTAGNRSADPKTGMAEPHNVYRDTFLRATEGMPLTTEDRHYLTQPLTIAKLDLAGLQIVHRLIEAGENFGGLATDAHLPVMATPYTVTRYPGGHVVRAPGLADKDACSIAWIDYATGAIGGRGRGLEDPPEFDGAGREITVLGAA